jgi:hypothetical protein
MLLLLLLLLLLMIVRANTAFSMLKHRCTN